MIDVTERWRSERVTAAVYDAGVKHDNVARVGAWAMWGTDMRRMFADVERLADAQAARRGVQDAIELVQADVTALRFADASFDLCVTYNGLHCLPDPRAALGVLTRVLKPGGTLRGTSCVTGRRPRKDVLIAMPRRAGVFGNAPHAGEIERWLREFGLDVDRLKPSGAVEFFEARLPFREQAQ